MRIIGLYIWFHLAHILWAVRSGIDEGDINILHRRDAAKTIPNGRVKTSRLRDKKAEISDRVSDGNFLSPPQRETEQNYPPLERSDIGEIGERRQFGQRSFGPISRFQVKKGSGLEWICYFYEETFLPVLQTQDRLLVDCTVIEVRQEWEQEEAMNFFGPLMTIYPLSLSDMVQLITLCGSVHSQHSSDEEARHLSSSLAVDSTRGTNSERQAFSTLIFPGTLWCGMKDNADRYELLGDRKELDRCCRAHDHCPIKLGSFEGRYGISSSGFTTKSHCLCELEFFRCLKGAKSQTADLIGNFYFNVLNIDCLEKMTKTSPSENHDTSFRSLSPLNQGVEHIYKCVEWDSKGKCRFWQKEKNANNDYTTRKFNLRF